MGRKGGRNTAKTGDVALYKSRPTASKEQKQAVLDNDGMFNEVDQYHNRLEEEEFLTFEQNNDKTDDESLQEEAVLDLGLNVEDDDKSSNSSSSSSNASSDEENNKEAKGDSSSSEDDDDDDMEEQEDVLDWGTSKAHYYHGDTADLELGQDEDDAFVEEEAAQEVLQKRYEDMDEDDFLLDDKAGDDAEEKLETPSKGIVQTRKGKMSKREQRKFLESHHVEVLPLVQHFRKVIQDYNDKTSVVTSTLLNADKETTEEIGTTPMGLQYLLFKSACQASTALNVAMYLLLKAEQAESNNIMSNNNVPFSHPVLNRLQQYNALLQKCNDEVEEKQESGGLKEQIEKLLEATELMRTEDGTTEDGNGMDDSELEAGHDNKEAHPTVTSSSDTSNSDQEEILEEDDDDEMHEDEVVTGVLNEARFGLRLQEIGDRDRTKKSSRRNRVAWSQYGPNNDDDNDEKAQRASRSLASTVNAIEQRSQTRKRRVAPTPQEDEDIQEDDLGRGLAMMDAEGLFASDEEEKDKKDSEQDELSDDDDNGFYSQVKKHVKAKKDFKKDLYSVAPKYPGMEEEVEGERAIGRTILKNRGLVAHKSKLNRNPRVKKREQYRKALIRRKGTVREVRTNEGHKYGGEETGIKSKLSRSRKLGVK